MIARIWQGDSKEDPLVGAGAALFAADLPERDAKGVKVDFYFWYAGSAALYLLGGESWKKWNAALQKALLEKQNRHPGDCRCGSWEPFDRWSQEGGRIYATALGALTLETYYRLPLSQK